MATLAGQTLGQYQVIERLGRGGMAEVYKGFHPKLERYAAIKVLHGFLAEGEDFLARFQREAKAIAALSHPNIVNVYDFDLQDDLYYMVIEFVDGGTLKERLLRSKGPLPLPEVIRIFREVASALEYAHRRGVLHRDIKPANVLLDTSGRAVLTDFGIARIVSDTQFTVTGTLVGTPAYMSPEQGKGLHVSEASDIYALGIVLYEMVTGRVPFEADTPFGIIHKHINEPLPLPRAFRDDIPAALETVILKALEKEPAERYQTPGEMSQALDKAAAGVFENQTLATSPGAAPQPDIQVEEAQASETRPASIDTIASKATVAMEAEDDIVQKTTVVMEPDETIADPEVEKAASSEPQKASRTSNQPAPARKSRQQKTTSRPSFKPLPIVLGVLGLALIAVLLIWGLPILTGGGEAGCASLEECYALSEQRMAEGDFEGAVAALDAAIGQVPEDEHPPNAELWCRRGEMTAALDRYDDAIGSFENCIAWTEDDPGQEELRAFAQGWIDDLSQR